MATATLSSHSPAPASSPNLPPPVFRTPCALPEVVRVLDVADSLYRWQTAAHRARPGELVMHFCHDLGVRGAPLTFEVASASRDGVWYTVSDRLVCSCPAGLHGHICRHASAVARWMWNAAMLRQCSECGRWELAQDGEYRHTGGDTLDRWVCTSCLGGAA